MSDNLITLSLPCSPYFAHLLVSFHELMQLAHSDYDEEHWDDCTYASIRQLCDIMSEVTDIACTMIKEEALNSPDVRLIQALADRIQTSAEKKLRAWEAETSVGAE